MVMQTQVIAEIGWNFLGDLTLAESMIRSAAANGASIIKFQYWDPATLKPGPWDTDGRIEIYKKAALNRAKVGLLKKIVESTGKRFMSSVFNEDHVFIIRDFSDIIKIPGVEIANIDLLEEIASYNWQEIYLSTGTATMQEIDNALKILWPSTNRIILMHCVSSYPCKPENSNLGRIDLFKKNFKDRKITYGYSGHCEGIADAIEAISRYRVSWIEKHFTTNRSFPGRDNQFAILPEELKLLTDLSGQLYDLRILETKSQYMDCEKEARELYRGRWCNGTV